MSDRAYANAQVQQKTLSGSSPKNSLLQRTCACGQHTLAGGECEECRKKREGTLQRSQRAFEPPSAQSAVPGSSPALENGPSFNSAFDRESRFEHDFSQIPIHTPAAGVIQTKLAINKPGDVYEQEADQMAEQVMHMTNPEVPLSDSKDVTENVLVRKQDAALGANAATESPIVPPIVHDVLNSNRGQPLDASTRAFMEPRFGHDFSQVRVHTDEQSSVSAQSVNALAYTVGRNVVFGMGQYQPRTSDGRRLLAHELTHVVQQSRGGLALQRFVPCTRARLSLEECPRRVPDEERQSRLDPMIVEFITAPEVGYLIGNFAVGQSALKASVKSHPDWPQLVNTVTQPGSQWQLWGLSDCHGNEKQNKSLRQQRAGAVRAALPAAAAAHIVGASGASLYDCITDNTTLDDRAWNRSVLITAEQREINFEPTSIKGTRPVPKPVNQPTADCSDNQKKEVAQAQPIAVEMVRQALYVLRDRNNAAVKQLLRKYFNDDSDTTYERVHDGLLNTLQGLRSDVKLECESKGSFMYDRDCPSSKDSVTTGYVYRHFGFRVHLCEAGFGRGDLELAATLVHEFSHLFDLTKDKKYCWVAGGCSLLSPEVAYDNADSYASFAKEAFTKL